MFSPAREAVKKSKCPGRADIQNPPENNTSQQKEKETPIHVDHDIAEYIDKAFTDVARLRERFNIKLDTKKFEEAETKRED